MTIGLWTSLILVLLAGVLQGSFAAPMKYTPRWRHENIWLVFAFTGLVAFPWILTLLTVPHLAQIYAEAPAANLMTVVAFGVGWGVGAVLTGVGMKLLGIGLGLGIILGVCASVGSLVPYLMLENGQLFSGRGVRYLTGSAIMFAGIALVAAAGMAREKAAGAGQKSAGRNVFWIGLAACVGSGLLSSMLNFSFAFGTGVLETASRLGTSPLWTSNVVIAPATTGGFLANLIYCAYHFRREHSLPLFWKVGTASHWLAGAVMGLAWFGGLALYGVGQHGMGRYGTIVGWPIMMGSVVLVSNATGLITGEWRNAGGHTKGLLVGGCAIILAALLVLAGAQTGS